MAALATCSRPLKSCASMEISARPDCASRLLGLSLTASRKLCWATVMSPLARAARPSQILTTRLSGLALAAFWSSVNASLSCRR